MLFEGSVKVFLLIGQEVLKIINNEKYITIIKSIVKKSLIYLFFKIKNDKIFVL